ncbi:MAG: alpha/beta hydrolase [Ilumatobacteraceae bacterium]
MSPDVDPDRFAVHRASPRGFAQAFVREGIGGVPVVCVHGWPESKRVFWRVIEPLAAAGFEVIVPDLRGFGDSEVGPDGFHDVASHARDLYALVHDHLGHERVVLVGGDLGGPVIQDLALRYPDWVDRMVLFNSPLPYLKDAMADIAGTRPPREAADYFLRQGTDPDGLAAELTTPEMPPPLHRHVLHEPLLGAPGSLLARRGRVPHRALRRRCEAARQLRRMRATSEHARSEPAMLGRNDRTPTLVLFGPSDHALYPAFDRMAAAVFARHTGPFLLRDCGHFVPWEAPHALTSGTVAFCSDLLAAGGA